MPRWCFLIWGWDGVGISTLPRTGKDMGPQALLESLHSLLQSPPSRHSSGPPQPPRGEPLPPSPLGLLLFSSGPWSFWPCPQHPPVGQLFTCSPKQTVQGPLDNDPVKFRYQRGHLLTCVRGHWTGSGVFSSPAGQGAQWQPRGWSLTQGLGNPELRLPTPIYIVSYLTSQRWPAPLSRIPGLGRIKGAVADPPWWWASTPQGDPTRTV